MFSSISTWRPTRNIYVFPFKEKKLQLKWNCYENQSIFLTKQLECMAYCSKIHKLVYGKIKCMLGYGADVCHIGNNIIVFIRVGIKNINLIFDNLSVSLVEKINHNAWLITMFLSMESHWYRVPYFITGFLVNGVIYAPTDSYVELMFCL